MNIRKSIAIATAQKEMKPREYLLKTGFSPAKMSLIKNGKQKVTDSDLRAMASAVGMKASEFIALGEDNERMD